MLCKFENYNDKVYKISDTTYSTNYYGTFTDGNRLKYTLKTWFLVQQ